MTFKTKTTSYDIKYLPLTEKSSKNAAKKGASAPPEYPEMVLQQFVISKGIVDRNLKAFPSQNAFKLYKEHKKVRRCLAGFALMKLDQNKGIGLPLLVSKRALSLGFGDTTYLRFYETKPAPDKDRLYCRSDNHPIGHVMRRFFMRYVRYRLVLKGQEFVVISHKRLPIMDFAINGDRYRFVKAKLLMRHPERFTYHLYLLTPEQPSLVDGMGSSLRVRSGNKMLGGFFTYLFPFAFSAYTRSRYVSPHKCGTVEFSLSWDMLARTRKCATFSMFTEAVGKEDVNSAVDFRTLVFMAIGFLIQSREDDIQSLRRTGAEPMPNSYATHHRR